MKITADSMVCEIKHGESLLDAVKKLDLDMMSLASRPLAAQIGGCDSFLRAALALTVFQERGLISLSRQEDRVTLCLNPIQGKVDLYASPCLRRLRGGAEVKRGDSQ